MAGARKPGKPTFLWQAVLILLPVLILGLVGAGSLRQDRLLAQREATERAQAIADDLLPQIWSQLTGSKGTNQPAPLAFKINYAFELIFPPPFTNVPTPQPFNLAELTTGQSQLWIQSQRDEARDPTQATVAWRKFLETRPPDRFAAAANFALGVILSREGTRQEAMACFQSVIKDHPGAISASGLPLRVLVEAQLLKLNNHGTDGSLKNVSSFCSNIVDQPTPLTPYFLSELLANDADAQSRTNIYNWQRLWAEHEQLRQLYQAARQRLLTGNESEPGPTLGVTNQEKTSIPRLFWFTTPDALPVRPEPESGAAEARRWLGIRVEDGPPFWIICRGESEVGSRVRSLLDNTKRIPGYFGFGIEVAGLRLTRSTPDLHIWEWRMQSGGKGGGQYQVKDYATQTATNVLASAAKMDNGLPLLKLEVYLTSPSALYQSQIARTYMFGALILVCAVAAVIGLSAAWGAFNRQQRLHEMKSNFVSSVSHELRAPIASVRLMAESLERGKVSEPAKQGEYFRFIGQECRRLSSLIENVLDFSRIEQGRKQYEFEPTDIVALVQQTVKLMEPYAVEKGVRLETFPSPGLTATLSPSDGERDGVRGEHAIELNVDGRAIQQALVNLIDNAIKHSPANEVVEIEVRGAKGQAPGVGQTGSLIPDTTHLTLSVTDYGPGIPASEHERIFERFHRLGSELRRETQGVGIGLSIVKHIVEAHGGRVRVESEPGKGSRFIMELPLNR